MKIEHKPRRETVHLGVRVPVELRDRIEAVRNGGGDLTLTDVVEQLLDWALTRLEKDERIAQEKAVRRTENLR